MMPNERIAFQKTFSKKISELLKQNKKIRGKNIVMLYHCTTVLINENHGKKQSA